MTFNRSAQRATIAIFFFMLALVYAAAWSLPAIGSGHDDASYLVTAHAIAAGHGYMVESLPAPVPQTEFPPLFPAVLALFTLVSQQARWLKLLPLACAAGWLVLTRKLLLKMGASKNAALLLAGLTAASPTVVFLSTNLLPESLFALLVTATLLALLEERALLAGLLAGLATLTGTTGVALIAACILTLVVRRRFRSALIFSVVAMAMAAPWFGWSLAHAMHNSSWVASDILTGLAANEKLVVLSRNFLFLLASPFSLLTGLTNMLAVIGTIVILVWCFYKRRQLVPDLFVALYCLVLLCRISPPERSVAPILPLVIWIVWRAFRLIEAREAMAALVLIAAVLPLWADAARLFPARASGSFAAEAMPADDWKEMRKMFGFIRANTAPESILLANLDGAFYLNTGRKAIRGFAPNAFDLFYALRRSAVTPDRLSNAIVRAKVNYVVVTPDRGLAESDSFHKSVEALERGGVVEPVSIPGVLRDYRLLRVTSH
jgi:Gpi18-like mannosyltransferase